ncbi:hypothetical protein AGR56_14260 [Clostridium sp. DMHC 10]|uniref:hypothetical protein n=1 Tax=Clostridium sp. DMHC 10 TaxID=747377 RepID=UPI00069ED3E0|nr:hypothetical protein [Clostridium sp. DMHC 10]KOF57517.1 hypothetical protein AGR56_14260 [Clostridium sp. DMHC 10]
MAIIVPPIIHRGNPVGVLYRNPGLGHSTCNQSDRCLYSNNQGACYCVHNGVFYAALYRRNGVYHYYSSINPAHGTLVQVILRHWRFRTGTTTPCLENLAIGMIAEVRRTQPIPSPSNLGCVMHPASGSLIARTGTPVGVYFNEGAGRDIKNGVFLYWTNGVNRYCRLYSNDKPVSVRYAHWIIVASGNGVAMRLTGRTRTGIIRVLRVSTSQTIPTPCS